MAERRRYIGFDLGAESGRCVVGHVGAEGMELHELHRFATPVVRQNHRLHWDILAIFAELERGLTAAVREFGPDFDGISVDTWGVDYVLLDRGGRLLGYPYHYRDSRTDGMIDRAAAVVPKGELYARTGALFAPYTTLCQLLAEAAEPQSLLRDAAQLLMIPNYLLYLLSGVANAEYSIVSTTQLANPAQRDWAWDIISALGLPVRLFPPIVKPGTVLGPIEPELAARTGLAAGVPVIAGATHDTAAAVAAVPATRQNWGFLSSGTWSLLGIERSAPLLSEEAMRCNFTNEGGVDGTTRLLKNIIGLWPLQECRRHWREAGHNYAYAELTALAGQAGPAHAWIDVDAPELLAPGDMPQRIQTLLNRSGQESKTEPGWIVRCLLESLAFKYRDTARELEHVANTQIRVLHAVGGGIRNRLLNQLTSDALGIELVAGPVEGTIIGNIGVQALATGAIPDLEELRAIVADSFPQDRFRPGDTAYWKKNEPLYHARALIP